MTSSPEGVASTARALEEASLLLAHDDLLARHGGQLGGGGSHAGGRWRNGGRGHRGEPRPGVKLGLDNRILLMTWVLLVTWVRG